MIRADGTSTIVVTNLDRIVAEDTESGVIVRVENKSVTINFGGKLWHMTEKEAWAIRDCFIRALDESCAPASA